MAQQDEAERERVRRRNYEQGMCHHTSLRENADGGYTCRYCGKSLTPYDQTGHD